jgi:hypothetical protein
LERIAQRAGYEFGPLREVMLVNENAITAVAAKVEEAVWNLEGKRIALLGLSFKAGTDDVRSAPALALARRFADAGAVVGGTRSDGCGRGESGGSGARDLRRCLRGGHGRDGQRGRLSGKSLADELRERTDRRWAVVP